MSKKRLMALALTVVMLLTMMPSYPAVAACSHPSSTGTKVSTSYEPIDGDDTYHLKIDYYVMYCDSCGEVTDMSDERESEQEHTLNKYGYCSVCKYQTEIECDHTDTSRIQLG